MQLVTSKCPSCGSLLKVDKNTGTAICEYCGNEYVVEKDDTTSNTSNNKTSNITDNKMFESSYNDDTLVINGKKVFTTNYKNSCEWSFSIGKQNYNVLFENGKLISVNGAEAVKIAKLKSKESNMLEAVYDVDLGNGQIAKLCIRKKEATLIYEGKNLENGQKYEIIQIPKWAYVFVALYVVNFFLIIGGALGGAINMASAVISATIASDSKKNATVRVIQCILIYVVVTFVSFFLASAITKTLMN